MGDTLAFTLSDLCIWKYCRYGLHMRACGHFSDRCREEAGRCRETARSRPGQAWPRMQRGWRLTPRDGTGRGWGPTRRSAEPTGPGRGWGLCARRLGRAFSPGRTKPVHGRGQNNRGTTRGRTPRPVEHGNADTHGTRSRGESLDGNGRDGEAST